MSRAGAIKTRGGILRSRVSSPNVRRRGQCSRRFHARRLPHPLIRARLSLLAIARSLRELIKSDIRTLFARSLARMKERASVPLRRQEHRLKTRNRAFPR